MVGSFLTPSDVDRVFTHYRAALISASRDYYILFSATSTRDLRDDPGSSVEALEDPNIELDTDSEYSDASTQTSDHNTDSE
ncbi:hypothetical protein PR048_014485 [Dryococelus australis]|uniref:Uncharacterized protein n=1 Tax=Dryococelus australis TaxID=614101 RepID=A0ABQ9HED7_9NEOP|nr:hypothetical protein PR048_014485 [Dryococelus australis]